MQYRIFLASLFVLISFAYMDTASIMRSFSDKDLFKEYRLSDRFLGIGVKNTGSNSVKVVHVVSNTPAYKSGLSEGDIIIRIGNKEVFSAEEFKKDIDKLPKDKKISLTILKPDNKELRTLSLLPCSLQR